MTITTFRDLEATHSHVPPRHGTHLWIACALLTTALGCAESAPSPFGDGGGGGVFAKTDAVLYADTGVAQEDTLSGNAGDTFNGGNSQSDITSTDATNPNASDAGDVGGNSGGGPGDDGTCRKGCDDGLACTQDGCAAGSCTHKLSTDYCLSSGSCVAAGPVPGNPCLSCKPKVSMLALQPNAGVPCDDGVSCTATDTCDATGACLGKPAPGCCKNDLDCVGGAPCVSATCDVKTGQCKTQPKVGCCEQGVCCDPTTFAPKMAGTACGTSALQVEWACDGASMRKREAVAGCDGKSATTCSQEKTLQAWAPWASVQTCPQGQLCALSSSQVKPTCVTAPQCTSDAQCNDGKICTKDVCEKGECSHPPGAAGTPCGAAPLATEYSCGSSGAIMRRFAVSTCDGSGTACPAKSTSPVWGKWQVWKTCGFNETCKVTDKTQPGTCVGAPKCKPDTTCCTAQGEYAPKASPCGTKVVDTEVKCDGGKGGKLSIRTATAGCSGGSTSCFSYVSSYLAWGPWKVSKQCGALETCEVNYNKTQGSCNKKTQCSANGSCCDKDGFYEPKGSKCGASALKTEERCQNAPGSSSGKGGAIQERKAWRGCTGTSTYCSSSTTSLVWEPWVTKKTCPAAATCEVKGGKATCVTACSPSQSCCTATGAFAAKNTKCGSWSVKSEQKCSGSGKGSSILERVAFYGCSGSSASCSYASADFAWEAWKPKKTCESWQGCEAKFSNPTCTSPCTPSSSCCSKLGEFEVKGTACSTFPSKTETKCSGSEKGGKIMTREAVRGCSGTSSSCSYSTTNYVWSAWKVKTACKADQVCKGSYSHYCSTAP